MFIGEYSHNIDPKKRVAIPVKFSNDFGGKAVVTRGLDKCLFVYPLKTWEELSSKLGSLADGGVGDEKFCALDACRRS